MRVQLTRTRRERGEEGSVAVLTAVVAVVLLVVSSFVADFGMAYTSKRQLQTAADAGALAAAAVYTKYPGTCAELAANATYEAEAQAAADGHAEANRSAKDGGAIDVSCTDDGALTVAYSASGSTPTVFASLAGGPQKITTAREAEATTDVSVSITAGLRPLALCSAALPAFSPLSDDVFRIDYPGDGHKAFPGCPDTSAAGNWWTLDCPGERTGSTGQLETQIKFGCPDPVSIVTPQNTTSPATLSASLTSACPSAPVGSETCLSGDPGQADAGHIEDSWAYLIDHEVQIVLPVFCAPPSCTPTTVTGTGTNAVFPVHKLASMVVCGYHFGKNVKHERVAGACVGNGFHVMLDGSKDNYLVVVYKAVQTSGGTGATTCGLGGACDAGLRRVLLTK